MAVYRNLQEQVFENTKDIEELQQTTSTEVNNLESDIGQLQHNTNILIENVSKLQVDVNPLQRKTRYITETNEVKFEVNAPIYSKEIDLRQSDTPDNIFKIAAVGNGADFGIINGPWVNFTTNGLSGRLPGDGRSTTFNLMSHLSKTFVGNQNSNCQLSIGEPLGGLNYEVTSSIKTETSESYLSLEPLAITGSVSAKDSQGNTTSSSRLQLLTNDLKFYNTNNGEPTTWSVMEQIRLNEQIKALINTLNGNQ